VIAANRSTLNEIKEKIAAQRKNVILKIIS